MIQGRRAGTEHALTRLGERTAPRGGSRRSVSHSAEGRKGALRGGEDGQPLLGSHPGGSTGRQLSAPGSPKRGAPGPADSRRRCCVK